MAREWTDAEGTTWTIRREGDSLVFTGEGRRHDVDTSGAGSLEALDDEELRQMFESARSRNESEQEAGDSPSSPSAMGVESAPHADLADEG